MTFKKLNLLIFVTMFVYTGIFNTNKAFANLTIENKGTSNPVLLYNGNPFFGVGSVEEIFLFAFPWTSSESAVYGYYMNHEQWKDWMVANKMNFVRAYPESGFAWCERGASSDKVYPWTVNHWSAGKPVVDLTQLNTAYWAEFENTIQKLKDNGIVLLLQLYQYCYMSYGNVFDMSYFNPNNNINDWAINRTDFFDRIISDYNGSKTTWWPMHRNYVRKILDSIGNKGNVLIDLANEAGTGSFHCYEWVEKTIDIIEEWENENGIDILIGMDEHFWFRVPGMTTWVRDHSRLEILTGHGRTDVMHEVGYDSSMGYSPHDIGKLRMDYHKPAVSIHNGSGVTTKEADWQKHYQWLALMQKCQGAASYGYGTWLEDFAQRTKFEQQTGYLLGFFNTLRDYTSLIVSNEKIVLAPGYSKYKYLLSSSQEAVFYTHNYGYGATTSAGQILSIENLNFTDGNVNITFLHPENGSTSSSTGTVSGGSITITLPPFYEDITVYMSQAKLTPPQSFRVE